MQQLEKNFYSDMKADQLLIDEDECDDDSQLADLVRLFHRETFNHNPFNKKMQDSILPRNFRQ